MIRYHNYTDLELVESIKNANERAFEEVYNRFWYKLFSVAYHQIGSREEAEQLVQDVFEKLWKRREELQISNLSVYLVVSVKNLCINHIKSQLTFRKYQEYLIFQEISHHDPHDSIKNIDNLIDAIENALKTLPEKTVEVFKLSRFENQSHKEIAAKLNLTEKAIEYHITKSMKHLRENLKSYYFEN